MSALATRRENPTGTIGWLAAAALLAVLLVACSGAPAATPASTATARPATASPVDPVQAAAERDCPRKYASDCIPSYVEMAGSGLPAALCVWPDFTWSFVTPDASAAVGDYGCGTDGE